MDNKLKELIKCAKDPVYFLNNYGYVFNAKKQTITRMTCYSYQEDCVKRFHEHQNNIILKSRQCLPASAKVNTPKGLVSIKDIRKGDLIYSYNLEKKVNDRDHVVDHWESGVKVCYSIMFNDGEIEAGEDHPFYVINKGWVIAGDIDVGDKVVNFSGEESEVVSKFRTGKKECYDISVDKNENFFVNNYLVHNTGLSVVTAGYAAWRLIFRNDEKILIIANDGNGAVRFLDTVKQFYEYTPDWLKPSVVKNNEKKIILSNKSYAEAKASSPDAGRGDSLTMLILDETAFIRDADAIWMGAGMALSATEGKCIMISTPNGTSGLYYRTWKASKGEGNNNDFESTTVHWTENPNSSIKLEYRENSEGEKEPWSPWYEAQCKRLNWDSVKIAQELDLSFEGSKMLAIEPKLIQKYEKRVNADHKPVKYMVFNFLYKDDYSKFGKFTDKEADSFVFKMPEEGASYILASDIARGDGGDYSTIQVLNADTLEQVFEFRGHIGVDLFPYIIDYVGRMYNTAYVVVEANNFGLGVGFDLRDKLEYPRNRLFFSKSIQDMHVSHYQYEIAEGTEVVGFQTTKKSRPLIIKSIIEHMRENSLILHSKRLISELQTFVMKGDKPEHEAGFNDDLIFALGIALYVRDTEYNNVSASNELTKSMLNALLMNSTSSVGDVNLEANSKSKKSDQEINSIIGTIMIMDNKSSGGDSQAQIDIDDDDLSWLMG